MVKSYLIFKCKTPLKVLTLLCIFMFSKSWGQTTIFSENMGTGATAGAAIGTYTGFQNYGTLTFTGTGDMRTSTASTGYTGASGSNNVYFNGIGENFQIAGINTSTCSALVLTFGLYKSTNAETGSNMVVETSPDGVTYTPLSFSSLPTGSGTVGWYLITINTGIPSTANLRIRFRSLVASDFRVDDVKLTGTCGISNTITTGAVSNAPFALTNCTATATGTVAFTSTGTFNAGNTYTAQLSDASGSFASPVNIGTLVSTANSGSINITIPGGTASGTGYIIRVISDNPAVTGSNSSAFTITLTCATASGSCTVNGVMGTGNTFGCGNASTACNLASVYSSFGTFCGTSTISCGSSCVNTNVSATYNFEAGCTATVIAEYKARTAISSTGCNNSAMDAGDQISITNSGGVVSSQTSTMVVSVSTCATYPSLGTYTTAVSNLTTGCGNSDGTVRMVITGGAVTIAGLVDRGDEIVTYTINASGTCSVCPVLLPVGFVDFYGVASDSKNDIFWKVDNEDDIEFYMIEKSSDGINFDQLGIKQVNYINYSSKIKTYSMMDDSPYKEGTYYRISVREKYGVTKIHGIIYIDDASLTNWKSNYYQRDQNLWVEFKNSIPKNSTITLFDLSGKLLTEEAIKDWQTKINTQSFADGIYFMRITTPYKTENFKLIIQK